MVQTTRDTDMEVPGLEADVYITSIGHLATLEKFGRKWYDAGVKAGLAEAKEDPDHRTQLASAAKSDGTEDVVAALIARNDELEEQVKELIAFKKIAVGARDRLSSASASMTSIIDDALGVIPQWLVMRFTTVSHEVENYRNQCNDKIDRASRPSKKRPSESQGPEGSSSKRSQHN